MEVYKGRPPSAFSELPSGPCSLKQGLEAWASFEVFLQRWDTLGWQQTPHPQSGLRVLAFLRGSHLASLEAHNILPAPPRHPRVTIHLQVASVSGHWLTRARPDDLLLGVAWSGVPGLPSPNVFTCSIWW